MYPKFRIGRALAAFVVVGAIALPLLYLLAITIVPARTSDGQHAVMPIGQVGFAILVAPVLAAIVAYRVGRPVRP